MKTTSAPINDDQSLVSAAYSHGLAIPVYDDGFGALYIHRDSMGISGIVRAQSWEDAYSICEDEFFPEAGETCEEMAKEYATEFMSGRELWLHENGNSWDAWQALSEAQKSAAYSGGGKDVPFAGNFTEHDCWQEAYGFRPNGRNSSDKIGHGIYAKDMNGDSLELLTPELVAALGITLEIVTNV